MWAGILVIVAMCIFPPWDRFTFSLWDDRPGYWMDGGYRFFLSPPPSGQTKIDWGVLFPPIVVVAIIAGGLIVTLRDRRPPSA